MSSICPAGAVHHLAVCEEFTVASVGWVCRLPSLLLVCSGRSQEREEVAWRDFWPPGQLKIFKAVALSCSLYPEYWGWGQYGFLCSRDFAEWTPYGFPCCLPSKPAGPLTKSDCWWAVGQDPLPSGSLLFTPSLASEILAHLWCPGHGCQCTLFHSWCCHLGSVCSMAFYCLPCWVPVFSLGHPPQNEVVYLFFFFFFSPVRRRWMLSGQVVRNKWRNQDIDGAD